MQHKIKRGVGRAEISVDKLHGHFQMVRIEMHLKKSARHSFWPPWAFLKEWYLLSLANNLSDRKGKHGNRQNETSEEQKTY